MEIKLVNVSYFYKNNSQEAIKKINTVIHNNSINGIIGLNDSGKSTLVNMIAGLIKPVSGEVLIDDEIVDVNNHKKLGLTIGIVYQNPEEQIINLTVKDEIEFGLEYYNYRKNDREKHIRDSLKMVELDDSDLNKNPFSLSQGEMRKVALASILALNPKIIILDEPTVGLDYNSKKNLIKIIRILKNRFHKTIILVSKDMDLVHKLSDYIYILSNGKLVKSGTKYEIFTDFELLKKYHIYTPKVIDFSKVVLDKKKIKLGYRDDINDLLKDIYRFK